MLAKRGRRLFDNVSKAVFILPNVLSDKNPDVLARHISDCFRLQINITRLRDEDKSGSQIRRFIRPSADTPTLRKNFLNSDIGTLTLRTFAGHSETSQTECQFRRVTDEMSAVVVAIARI